MQKYSVRYYKYVFKADLDNNKINPVTMMNLCEFLGVDMKAVLLQPFHDGAIEMTVQGSGTYILERAAPDTPLTQNISSLSA